jgi:hypothetical protein
VNLRHLLCNPKDGRWKLSEEYVADEVSAVHSEHTIVHLSWNHMGNDLAIVDMYGQISVFTILIALNRLTVSRRCIIDPEDNLCALVGFTWLNTERMVFMGVPIIKIDADVIASFVSSRGQAGRAVEFYRFPAQTDGAT